MLINERITSLHALHEALTELRGMGYTPPDRSTYAESMEITSSLTRSWARGEWITCGPQVIVPSLDDINDSNFYMLREYMRRYVNGTINFLAFTPYAVDGAEPHHHAWIKKVDDRAMVSFYRTENDARQDTQTLVSYARYAVMGGAPENEARIKAESFAAAYDDPIFDIITDPEEISRVYQSLHGSLKSCMTYPPGHFGLEPHLHPMQALGGQGDLALAVLWDSPEKRHITARSLVWPARKLFSRCYGQAEKLATALRDQHWERENFNGAKLVTPVIDFEKRDGKHAAQIQVLMPYIDKIAGEAAGGSNGCMGFIPTRRGAFVHEGVAYAELELTEEPRVGEGQFWIEAGSTNHHGTGRTWLDIRYYPKSEKIYFEKRTTFIHILGYPKPRRFDYAELVDLGVTDMRVIEGAAYDQRLLYIDEYSDFVAPRDVYNRAAREPLVILNGVVYPRASCVHAVDSGTFMRRQNAYLDALTREYRENRLQFAAELEHRVTDEAGIGSEIQTQRITASSINHLILLLRETDHGHLTLHETNFDNGEVQLQIVDRERSDRAAG